MRSGVKICRHRGSDRHGVDESGVWLPLLGHYVAE